MEGSVKPFSDNLQAKLDPLMAKRRPIKLGELSFDSRLLMAPMASICNIPFRILTEDLGSGGVTSELISCHGINYKNKKTHDMLKIDPAEKNVGLQLFGEDKDAMTLAAQTAAEFGPKFIDINMGCPVKKVVAKGGGSALMKDLKTLGPYLEQIKRSINIPLTIKIRTGWDMDQLNAAEVMNIAYNSGVEFVSIHGRTRSQQYTGQSNWEYIEGLNQKKKLPLVGNGDLHQPRQVSERLKTTNCDALMIARGALRNPFIFLESLDEQVAGTRSIFDGPDYWEVIERLVHYITHTFSDERQCLIQSRKLIVWFAAGFKGAAFYRGQAFKSKTLDECLKYSEDFFLGHQGLSKYINYSETFMTSGHG
jgi:tRNA-dihydrouridine synthase B